MRRRNNERNKPQPQEPQAWITLLWHMGLRLPWTWKLGPSNASERAHVMEMVTAEKFPRKTLFCGDAGFVGYSLWSTLMASGEFLVRVGGNVSLLSETANWKYETKKTGIVLCWPKNVQSEQPPLRLRLVQVRIGKAKVYLLTSVLDPKELSVRQMSKFYQLRWGIELGFRGLKQTLGRGKLRCRNPHRVMVELHWSLLAMTIVELFALKEQLAAQGNKRRSPRPPYDPAKRSLAQAAQAIRSCLRDREDVPAPGKELEAMLAIAITDRYARRKSKRARYRPKNPDKKALGTPQIRKLTAEERKKMAQVGAGKAA